MFLCVKICQTIKNPGVAKQTKSGALGATLTDDENFWIQYSMKI